jgi:hypothetical protein
VGTWGWTASYNGDLNNNSASSGCNDEQVAGLQPTGKIAPTQTTSVHYNFSTKVDGTAVDIDANGLDLNKKK